MPIPPTAFNLPQPLSPPDILDFSITLAQEGIDSDPYPFLQAGEKIATFALTLTAEAVALGLKLQTGSGYPGPTIIGNKLTFWCAVEAALQGAVAFQGVGQLLALELTAKTDNTPPRQKQRTITVKVAKL